MTSDTLLELLEGNGHTPDPADEGREPGSEEANGVVVSCPMARRTSSRLWPLGPLDTVSDVTRLGNQPWEFVEGEDGIYGGFPGTHYLVCLNGERNVPTLRSRVPPERDVAVASVRN